MPRRDNTFGGGNYDADDLDEWLTLQRDWQVDGGIEPVGEEEVLGVRGRAATAVQAVFSAFGFPAISDEEVEAATHGSDSRDLPDRDRAADVEAADRCSRTASPASTSPSRSPTRASRTWPRRCSGCSASGSRRTTSRPRRSSRRTGRSRLR
jgi:hypothetical protein